jgi:hypothetical protein
MAGASGSEERSRTEAAFHWFVVVQVTFVVYVVAEVAVALGTHLHASENTSSIGMKGDTAVTASWPMTLVWAIFIVLVVALKGPIARGVFAFLATLYAISITVGNSTEVFGTHHFTGWHWDLIIALDVVATVFTVLCVLAALTWARRAKHERSVRLIN